MKLRTGFFIESALADFRLAWRRLCCTPGFAAVAVLTLAIGIGVNGAVFTIVHATLFGGFPLVADNDRLVYLRNRDANGPRLSYEDFQELRTQAKSLVGLAAASASRVNLDDNGGDPQTYEAEQVSVNSFRLLGQRPIMGRDFEEGDAGPAAARVILLSYRLWESRYRSDPTVIGQTMRVDGAPATVIGVMPPGFSFPRDQDLWMPLKATPFLHLIVGRMADGVGVENVRAEMAALVRRLTSVSPADGKLAPPVQTFGEFFIGPTATRMYAAMWAAVGFVLLIACANLANLMLARSMSRSREISVVVALGASRLRIVQQLMAESAILSAFGGALGVIVATLGVRAYRLVATPPGDSAIDHALNYSLNYAALGYLFALSAGAALLFGLWPALNVSRANIGGALNARGTAGGRRGRRMSSVLVAGEMALALVLLAAAGITTRSFLSIFSASGGVNTQNVLTGLVQLPASAYSPAARVSLVQRLKRNLENEGAVESVAVADWFPTWGARSVFYELPGESIDKQRMPKVSSVTVSPAYFHTLGAAVLAGREFNARDDASGTAAVIVNQKFAEQHWSAGSALGQRLRVVPGSGAGSWLTVVGVVSNISQTDFTRQAFEPLVYLPYAQSPTEVVNVIVRTRVAPGLFAQAFRKQLNAAAPTLPVFGPYTLAERLKANYWSRAVYGSFFAIFAAVALLLASLGIYALVEHSVRQRRREIGVRIAVGATPRDVLTHVFRHAMRPVGIGLVMGLAGSMALGRVFQSIVVHVSPADPVSLAFASAVLVLCAVAGCWVPVRRAMRLNPVAALQRD